MNEERAEVQFAVAKISKANLNGQKEEFEDGYVLDERIKFFAIFDGLDGEKGSEYAVKMATEVAKNIIDSFEPPKIASHLCWMLEQIDAKLRNDPRAGGASAVLARVVETGEGLKLIFAAVGDSRLYMRRKGQVFQVTIDDGMRAKDIEVMKDVNEEERMRILELKVKKYLNSKEKFEVSYNNSGEIEFEKGDRILICTDGVSGKKSEERLEIEDIEKVFARELDDKTTAEVFVRVAKKNDDRIAIVVSAR